MAAQTAPEELWDGVSISEVTLPGWRKLLAPCEPTLFFATALPHDFLPSSIPDMEKMLFLYS